VATHVAHWQNSQDLAASGTGARMADETDAQGRSDPGPAPQLLSAFWELAPDMLALLDPDGTVRHVNPAVTRLLGWPRDHVVGRVVLDLVHPADQDATVAALRTLATAGGLVEEGPVRLLTSEGAFRSVRWTARTSVDGRTVHAVGRDVTEEAARMEALQLSEERLRLSVESSPVGALTAGLDGTFLSVNDAFCRILGRPRDLLMTLTFRDITHPEDLPEDERLIADLLSGEISQLVREKRYLHADGSTVWALVSAALVRSPEGRPLHFLTQVQDVTDRHLAQEHLARTLADLRQSNTTLAEFASVAAHDLKAPLAVASGAVEVVLAHYADALPDPAVELLHRGDAQLHGLGRQVDGLLRIATISARPLALETVLVGDVTADAVRVLAGDGAVLPVRVDAPCVALADRAALQLLLQNLIGNGLAHGGTRVEVRAHADDEHVHIEVDDDGPGVPARDRVGVFELFSRAPATDQGTGIGLALCRRIVERHEGTIAIDEAPLGGARLSVTLPLPTATGARPVTAGGRRR
jgi:PAS domain S-box-containing protein